MRRLFQHMVSTFFGWLANTRWKLLKDHGIAWFIRHYGVDLTEAVETDPHGYATFNDFFTRQLKPGARPLAQTPGVIISPVDGCVSACGKIAQDQLFQAKGHQYSLDDLLAHQSFFDEFVSGTFLTAYLSPKDYHRVHMPVSGKLFSMHFVPGTLFPVNPDSVANTPRLFARNERVILYFDTESGPMTVIFVGALIVGSMVLTHHGVVRGAPERVTSWHYNSAPLYIEQGAELGYFRLGSTVILLHAEGRAAITLNACDTLRMGQHIGHQV